MANSAQQPVGRRDHPSRDVDPGVSGRFATVSIPEVRSEEFASEVNPIGILQPRTTAHELPLRHPANVTHSQPAHSGVRSTSLTGIKQALERTGANECQPQMPELVIEPRRENEPTTPSPRQTAEARSREAGSKKPLKPHGDCPLAKLNPREPQIQPVVDTIVQRYLPGSSSLLAFCMSDDNRQLIPAVLSTAAALRERTAARILLIDSEHDRRELSSQMDCTDKQGLIEMSRGHNQLLNLVQATHHPDVDFLPCGLGEWPGSEKFNQCIQRSVAGFTGNYGYVLVSVGVAHSVAADVWAQYADGTFLLVNLKSSNRTIARSAVTQLNSFGARLLGCIATHCE